MQLSAAAFIFRPKSCFFIGARNVLQRDQWHGPSMVAEDEEFLITSPGLDCIQVSCSTQEVVRAPLTSRSRQTCRDQVQSAMPQQLVDTVKAKFMQTPKATQFEMRCKQDCDDLQAGTRGGGPLYRV